ncbi:hypothetical protein SASPL_116841 [Salvia splendens]|uniref:Terpene synthase metal-binding domain-containing protein n=1 Tax=Salvia splendens TaxID=180675 RepID=A0A8X8ZVR7_SALSN|nr:hypothetical protein SASPL_116841 [Salvia splendens]
MESTEKTSDQAAGRGRTYSEEMIRSKNILIMSSLKEVVRSYYVEAKWFIEGHLPPFEEYLETALITCTYCYIATSSLLGIQSAIKEDFEWLSKKPKMLVAALTVCRVVDDIATYETEKDRGQVATGIECYMKEYGATKEEAMAKFAEISTNACKDSNRENVCHKSRDILMNIIINVERLVDVTYKNNEDGYTHPHKVLKPHIIALLVDHIKI